MQQKQQQPQQQVLFICQSNRSISKMAAAYLAHKLKELGRRDIIVLSAGTSVWRENAMHQAAIDALAEIGVVSPTIGPAQLSLKDIKSSGLIVCMSDEMVKKITDDFQSARGKTIHLMSQSDAKRDVFEPRATLEACRQCLAMMRPALDRIAERLV